MKYEINTLVATVIKKDDAQKGAVGAIVGIQKGATDQEDLYLVELFNVVNHLHYQLWYNKNEIYAIQQ